MVHSTCYAPCKTYPDYQTAFTLVNIREIW